MRLAFLVLLLVNLVLLIRELGYLGGQETGREPERLTRQLVPEKLRILSTLPADDAAVPSPPLSPLPASPLPLIEEIGCKRLEGLTAAAAASVRNDLAAVSGWEAHLFPQHEPLAHWVLIPELSSRVVAEKKKTELRQLGIHQGQIVEDVLLGPFVVSLGIFRNESLAEEFLQTVMRQGARSARLAKRALPQEKVALELRAPAAELARKLPDLLKPLLQARVADCSGK